MINALPDSLKELDYRFHQQLKFHAQLSCAGKSVITSGQFNCILTAWTYMYI